MTPKRYGLESFAGQLLQEKIIEHMVECPLESENTNHIGKALDLSQPTVFKSVHLLEQENYIQTEQDYRRGRRTLKLTDKGVAAALISGKGKDKIYSYLQRRAPSSYMLMLMNMVKDRSDLSSEWMRLFIEYMLNRTQKTNELNEKMAEELIATLIVGPKNVFVDAKKLRSILARDQITWLICMLRNKIVSTNSLIDQLTIEESNKEKQKAMMFRRHAPKTMDIWKISLNRSTFAEIRNDTTKEMVFDIPRVDL